MEASDVERGAQLQECSANRNTLSSCDEEEASLSAVNKRILIGEKYKGFRVCAHTPSGAGGPDQQLRKRLPIRWKKFQWRPSSIFSSLAA